MSEKQRITEQDKQNLSHYVQLNIQASSELISPLRKQIEDLNERERLREKSLTALEDECHLRKLTEYAILLGLISLDLSAAYRTYLKADEAYEVQYATKHIVIILNEGFKIIYNYVWTNEKGDLKTSDRNKSIWKKDIGLVVNNEFPDMKDEYIRLTDALETFDDAELKALKSPRGIFVHYGDTPSLAYDEINNIDIEEISKKAIPFMDIIRQMFEFTFLLIQKYVDLLPQKTEAMFDEHYKILEDMKLLHPDNPAAIKEIETGQQNLLDIRRKYIENLNLRTAE